MNNLTVNDIDHSNFDLEWAKRGGVIHSLGYDLMKYQGKTFSDGTLLLCQFIHQHSLISLKSRTLRMATPSECEAAGVEYIDPPAPAHKVEQLINSWKELNMFNYTHDDVDRLNNWAIDAYVLLTVKEHPLFK